MCIQWCQIVTQANLKRSLKHRALKIWEPCWKSALIRMYKIQPGLRGRRSTKSWENLFRYRIKCILIPTSSKRHSSSPIENCFLTIWNSSVVSARTHCACYFVTFVFDGVNILPFTEYWSVTSSNFRFCITAFSWPYFSRTWWKILTKFDMNRFMGV